MYVSKLPDFQFPICYLFNLFAILQYLAYERNLNHVTFPKISIKIWK
jgi:hypothetical protein